MSLQGLRAPNPGPAAVGAAIEALSRLEIARLARAGGRLARGLTGGITSADLLNEAVLRALQGTRRCPAGLPITVFLLGVMRSIADEHRRAARRQDAGAVSLDSDGSEARAVRDTVVAPDRDPERSCAAIQALAALRRDFAGDPVATAILDGLIDGDPPPDIRARHGLSEVDYDTARRRLRRAVARLVDAGTKNA